MRWGRGHARGKMQRLYPCWWCVDDGVFNLRTLADLEAMYKGISNKQPEEHKYTERWTAEVSREGLEKAAQVIADKVLRGGHHHHHADELVKAGDDGKHEKIMQRLKDLEERVDEHAKALAEEAAEREDTDEALLEGAEEMGRALRADLAAEADKRAEIDQTLFEMAVDNAERLKTNDKEHREYKDLFDANAREHRNLDQRIKSVNTGLGKVLAQTPISAFTDGSK